MKPISDQVNQLEIFFSKLIWHLDPPKNGFIYSRSKKYIKLRKKRGKDLNSSNCKANNSPENDYI